MRVGLGAVVVLVLAVAVWMAAVKEPPPVAPTATIEPSPETIAAPATAAAEPRQRAAVTTPAVEGDHFLYRVRVVHADTAQPVAGAIVRWLPRNNFALAEEQRLLQHQEPESFLSQFGESATTDAEGRTSCRGPLGSLQVVARRQELFGQSWFTALEFRPDGPPATIAADTEFVVEVREDRMLTVRAIDGRGRPVPGVEVTLTRSVTNHDGETQRCVENLGPTDAAGLAQLRHAQSRVTGEPDTQAVLAAALFGGHGENVPVDLRAIPESPIDVRLPAFGSFDLTLLGPDGRPWQTPPGTDLRVMIRPAGDSGPTPRTNQNTIELDRDGKGTANPVRCGLDFHIRIKCGALVERTVTGPQRAGERVAVELRMPTEAPILVARVFDNDGAPVTGTIFFKYEGAEGSGSFRTGTVDGRLRVPLMPRMLDDRPAMTLTRYDERGISTGEQADVELSSRLVQGINDVGDLTLRTPPLLVSGRVQWADGSAVEPPGIYFERTRRNPRDGWENAWELRTEFPGNGQFVARGGTDGRRWRLQVHGNFVPQTREFTPGTADLVVRVEKSALVTDRFLFDEGAPWRDLDYRLLPSTSAADPTDAPGGRALPVEKDGGVSCLWGTLESGPYRLTVECPGVEPPLVDLTVDVPRGATATDPRLQNIDLRGRVRRLTVSVTDATGAPVQSKPSGVWIRGPDDPRAVWYGRSLDAEGRVALITHRPLDLQIHAAGFLTRDVSSVFADTIVTLDAAPRISVRLVGALAACPEGTVARLDCRPPGNRDAPRNRVLHRRLILDADGAGEILLGSDSPLQLSLLLRRGRRSTPVDLQPATLDPQTVSPGQVVELRIQPEALRRAIEALED